MRASAKFEVIKKRVIEFAKKNNFKIYQYKNSISFQGFEDDSVRLSFYNTTFFFNINGSSLSMPSKSVKKFGMTEMGGFNINSMSLIVER